MAETAEAVQQEMFQEALAPEPTAEPTPAPAPEPAPTLQKDADGVPSWRLREESEARRQAEDRARAFEARIQELEGYVQRQQPQPKAPDWFENPDSAMEAALVRLMGPIVQGQERQAIHNSRMIAGLVHGKEQVDAAEAAFLKARENGTLDKMDYERVVQSPNRYDAAVEWHQRNSIVSTVGKDPNEWFVKTLDQHLADPRFQAAVMERIRGNVATRPGVTRLPPSLSGKTAAAGNAEESIGDLSDKSLFDFAKPDRKNRA